MDDEDILTICRYEVGTIINNNRDTIHVSNDLETANNFYEATINKYWDKHDHVIVFLYDYDKNTNINYYDSYVENI